MTLLIFHDLIDRDVLQARLLRQGFAVGCLADAGGAGYDYVWLGPRHFGGLSEQGGSLELLRR